MAPRPYNAISIIETTAGRVVVRKAFAAKQRAWVLVFVGPQPALRMVLPGWRPRSESSCQTQLTAPMPIGSLAELLLWWQQLEPRIRERVASPHAFTVTGTSPPAKPKFMTLGDAADAVQREAESAVRPSSARTYQRHWSTIHRHIARDVRLADIDRERVQGVVGQLIAQGRSATTIRNVVGVSLRRALARAVEDGALKANPLDRVRLPKVIAKRRKMLTREQRDYLIEVAARHGRDIDLVVALAALAGLRRAEVLSLRWEQVDLRRRIVCVENGDGFVTKSGSERSVPICTKLLAILTRHRRYGGFVVRPAATKRSGAARWHFTKTYEAVVRETGVPRTTVHGLRHVFATLAAETMPLPRLKTILGHHSVRVTETYVHPDDGYEDIDRAVG